MKSFFLKFHICKCGTPCAGGRGEIIFFSVSLQVYYSSLSFGGYGSHSKAVVQTAHLITEEQLKKYQVSLGLRNLGFSHCMYCTFLANTSPRSGISYTSIREGIYAEAFPVFAAWYPDTTTMYIPTDGRIAWTSRSELGEANAKLMLRDPATLPFLLKNDYDNNVALLTGPRAYTFAHLAEALTRATGRKVTLQKIPREQYAAVVAVEDAKEGHGGKSAQFFELWASLLDAVGQGEAEMVAPLMGELLGRPPRDGLEHIEELVREAGPQGGYTWHQNYDIGKR